MKRFWDKVNKKAENECWEWLASKTGWGYGTFWYKNRNESASRFSWELHNGKIPEGMLALHKCDNPPCVNPEHLFLGTHKDNALDKQRKNRGNQMCGENQGLSKLTRKQVLEIRGLYIPYKFTVMKLAKIYNVTDVNISKIINRKTWKHI